MSAHKVEVAEAGEVEEEAGEAFKVAEAAAKVLVTDQRKSLTPNLDPRSCSSRITTR